MLGNGHIPLFQFNRPFLGERGLVVESIYSVFEMGLYCYIVIFSAPKTSDSFSR